jgi:hypothetical protein
MEAAEPRPPLSSLDLGILLTLVSVGIAGLVGLIAVFDAASRVTAVGKGFGVTFITFQSGATIAVALACLARRRAELLALAGLVAAGAALDLVVLDIWLAIHSETYAKMAAIAYVWSFFALIALGLTLAVQPRDALGRWLYLGAVAGSVLGALIATVLVASTGGEEVVPTASPLPVSTFGNEDLLRPLAAVLVVVASLWFATLAATRVERPPPDVTR